MASLYNNKISTTYVGLIKTIDNAVISASLRELTDGSGNATGLHLNNAGDFKVTSILEFGSLKDTGENITITKFVDEADGIASNDNDTTIPTSAAVVDYVASRITLEDLDFSGDSGTGSVDLDSQVFAIVGTANEIETSGGSQQLQIGLPTNITIAGTTTFGGNLIGNTNIILKDTSDNTLAAFYSGGKGEIYFNNSKKFETTSDGATVTGGLTATGSSVFTAASFSGTITGDLTGDVTGDLTGNVTATSVLADGVTATTQSASNNSTKVATTAYVDSQAALSDTLSEVLAIGNTTGATKISVDNTSSGIDLIDDAKIRLGTGNDLEIYHDGSNSYISDTGTGNLLITSNGASVQINKGTTENMAEFITDGSVKLYYDSVKKFETTSAGATITGVLSTNSGSGTAALGSHLDLGDNQKARFGASDDLEIYHDGSNSYIKDAGTGNLWIQGSTQVNIGGANGEIGVQYVEDAGVGLRHNNIQKLSTSSTGVSVTGNVVLTGNQVFENNQELRWKDSGGSERTTLELDSSNNLYLGTSAGGNLYLVNGSSYTTAVTIDVSQNASFSQSVTIAGDLTVNGTTTTVNTDHFKVEDPLISMAKDNAANTVDIGFYGKYTESATAKYLGLFSDASDSNTFKLFKGLQTEPTTTVDITATGYALADLDINDLTANNIVASGDIQTQSKVIFDYGGSHYLQSGTNSLAYKTSGGSSVVSFNASTFDTTFAGTGTFAGQVNVNSDLKVNGSTGEDSLTIAPQAAGSGVFLLSLNAAGSAYEPFRVDAESYNFTNAGTSVISTSGLNTTFASDIQVGGWVKGVNATNTLYSATSLGTYLQSPTNSGTGGNIYFRNISGTVFQTFSQVAGGTSTFAGDVTIGSPSEAVAKSLNILTGGSTSSVKLMEAGTVYGFSTLYDAATNKFHINRHNNSASGSNVLSFNRDDDNATFAGYVKAPYFTSDGGRSFKMDSVAFVSGYSNGADANAANDLGSATNQWRDLYLSNNIIADGDITLDSAGDISLDAGGNDIRLKVDGVEYGKFKDDSDDLAIFASIQDKDILFKGNDGGSTITALTLDMSNGGSATFRDDIDFGGKLTQTGTGTNTFAGDVTISNAGNGNSPILSVTDTADTEVAWFTGERTSDTGAYIAIRHLPSTAAETNRSGIKFQAKDDGDNTTTYAQITQYIDDYTGGTEDGALAFSTVQNATLTEVMRITEGKVGIGISTGLAKELEVEGNIRARTTGGATAAEIDITSGGTWRFRSNPTTGTNNYGLDIIKGSAGTDVKMSIDTNGNVGIGVTNPTSYNSNADDLVIYEANDFSGITLAADNDQGSNIYFADPDDDNVGGITYNHTSNYMSFRVNATERMRIDSAGALLVGKNGTGLATAGCEMAVDTLRATKSNSAPVEFNRLGSDGDVVLFYKDTSGKGSISISSSAVAYNTTSDYRLKEDLQDFAGLDMVSKIPVYDFKWKTDESRSYGVMAHELQEVLPDAVSGEKDAEEMQGVDYSKIVPLLVKSIQELKAEIEELKKK